MLALGRTNLDQRLKVLTVLLLLPCLSESISSRVGTRDVVPAPIVVPSSQSWEGNDGPWSAFAIQIGTPPQTLKVLISTSSTETWAVASEGCVAGDAINCQKLRGEIWNYNDSSTYVPNIANISSSIYGLDLETSLGLTGKGRYGFDTITLGWQGSGGPTLKNQTLAGIATKDYFMGLFGISPRPSNFTNFNHPIPSYMQNLRNQSLIPSTSWAYTAGNPYRLNAVFGSLTLGGYDKARLIPNQVYFPLSYTADFPVQIQGISTNNTVSLLSAPVPASLDSTVPYLYLPNATCLLFEKAFGLVWNDTANLYLLNDTQYATLKAQNPSITFQLSPQGSTATVNITFPYSAFDLTASAPLVTSKTRYFPLKPSNDTVPTTIGRTFFQEAYLIADFERKNFTISQCNWEGSLAQNIVAISPPTNGTSSNTSSSGSPLHLGAIVGIAVGGTMLLLLCCAFVYVYFIKPRRKHIAELATTAERARLDPNNDMIKPEMDGTGMAPIGSQFKEAFEADSTKVTPAVEAPGADIQPIFELPAREEVAIEMTGIGNRNAETALQPPRRNSKRKQMFTGRSRTSINSSDAVSPNSPADHGLMSPVSPQTTDPGSATMTSTAGSDALRQMGFPPATTSASPPLGEGTFSSTASSDILQQMGYHNIRSTGSPIPGAGEGTYSSGATSDILGVMGFPPRSPPPNLGEGTGQFSFVAGSDHLGGRSNMTTPGPPEEERTFSSAQSMQRHRQIRHKSSSEHLRSTSTTPISPEQERAYRAYSPLEQPQQQTPRSPTRRPVPNSSNNMNIYHPNPNPDRCPSPGYQQSLNLQPSQHLQSPPSPNRRPAPSSPSRSTPNLYPQTPHPHSRNPSPVSANSSTNMHPPQFLQLTSRQPSPATNLHPHTRSNLNLTDIRRSLAPSPSPAPSFTPFTHQSIHHPSHSNLNTNINPNPNPDTEPPSPLDEPEPGTGTWDSTLSSGSDILDVLGYGNLDVNIPPQLPLPTHTPEPEHDADFHVAPLRLSRGPSLSPNPRPGRGGESGVSSRVSSVSPIRGEEQEERDLGIRRDPRVEDGNRGAGGGVGYRPYRGEPS